MSPGSIAALIYVAMQFEHDLVVHRSIAGAAAASETSQTIQILAHDLKNVLAIMRASVDELFGTRPGARATSDIDRFRHSVGQASVLVRLIETVGRGPNTPPVAIDLNAVVLDAAPTLRLLLGRRIELRERVTAEPIPVLGDPFALERVLVNLVLNAREAMPHGGTVTIEAGLRCRAGGVRAFLSVIDTGFGIASDLRARLPQPFFAPRPEGTALGQSSVTATIQRMGGSLTIHNEPGNTEASVEFPLAPAPELRP